MIYRAGLAGLLLWICGQALAGGRAGSVVSGGGSSSIESGVTPVTGGTSLGVFFLSGGVITNGTGIVTDGSGALTTTGAGSFLTVTASTTGTAAAPAFQIKHPNDSNGFRVAYTTAASSADTLTIYRGASALAQFEYASAAEFDFLGVAGVGNIRADDAFITDTTGLILYSSADTDTGFGFTGSNVVNIYAGNGSTPVAHWTSSQMVSDLQGSASTPAYGFAGGVGMYQPNNTSDTNLALVAAGAEVMRLNNNRNVLVRYGGTSLSSATVGGMVYVSTTAVGNITTGEDVLISSYVAPASALSEAHDAFEITAYGTYGATANTKQIKVYFGTTVILDSGAVAINSGDWTLDCRVTRTGATTQKSVCKIATDNTLLPMDVDVTSPTETLSSTKEIYLTGTATATDDIVQSYLGVEWLSTPSSGGSD